MDYKNTSVNWASYIRELFCQYVSTIYDYTEFEGEVEFDESLFGRKKPVFKTWTPPTKEDEKAHNITIVPDTDDESVESSVEVTQSAQNVPVETESQQGPNFTPSW
ncbi:unnamed protein product [Mytilus coruscus]|uniref:Uncharacterized protein n=1 Tax=Mytilus coruscus TaxID=42192 RepID=A0A6J8F3N7_MYTCO|nr:unnamed protein product [Mytilus coruscus]